MLGALLPTLNKKYVQVGIQIEITLDYVVFVFKLRMYLLICTLGNNYSCFGLLFRVAAVFKSCSLQRFS